MQLQNWNIFEDYLKAFLRIYLTKTDYILCLFDDYSTNIFKTEGEKEWDIFNFTIQKEAYNTQILHW